MEQIKITSSQGEPPLSKKEITHARRILAQWRLVSADRVTYNSQYGFIDVENPKINLDLSCIVFTDDGEQARNLKQVDGFALKIKKWPPPHKREAVEKKKTRPQKTPLKSKRTRRH